jgi:hypothetical protein
MHDDDPRCQALVLAFQDMLSYRFGSFLGFLVALGSAFDFLTSLFPFLSLPMVFADRGLVNISSVSPVIPG